MGLSPTTFLFLRTERLDKECLIPFEEGGFPKSNSYLSKLTNPNRNQWCVTLFSSILESVCATAGSRTTRKSRVKKVITMTEELAVVTRKINTGVARLKGN